MKIKYLSSLVLCATLTLTACSDFLDVHPEGTPSTKPHFTNDQQVIDDIDALYAYLHNGDDLFGRNLFAEQIGAGDIVWGRSINYATLATFNYTGDESRLRSCFGVLYENIARANWVVSELLQKEKNTQLTPIEKRSLGEAFFLRGFNHFVMAYRYGLDSQGVPFVRYEDFKGGYDNSIPTQQKSVQDNYRMIVEDMDQAIKYLPRFEQYDADNRGRVHQAAAVALKAKVYAYWSTWDQTKWKEVITLVNTLETTYNRGLADSFADNFSSSFDKFWTKEYLWTIPGNGGDNPGGCEFTGVMLENKGWGKYNGWGQLKPTLGIYKEMLKDGAGNERLTKSILEYNQEFEYFGETRRFYSASDFETGFMINKYMDAFKYKDADKKGYVSTNGDWPTTRVNLPIIRFAEMLLFRAEAYLMTGQADLATADLNKIRNRVHLANLDHTATMADLYHERRCELAFEFSDHLFDLKRWHRSSDAIIKKLAADELNAQPTVRHYAERGNPTSTYTEGIYEDATEKLPYKDYMMVFPYPSEQVRKSGGLLKQNPKE